MTTEEKIKTRNRWLIDKNLNIRVFATAVGVSYRTAWTWINEGREPRLMGQARISAVFTDWPA